jgi:hypothetical protein
MRIATLIIGLVLSIICGVQSFILFVAGSGELEKAAGTGMGVSFSLLIASAFALTHPRVSIFGFIWGALVAIVGSSPAFPDLATWALISLFLSGLAYGGHRELRKKTKQAQH